MPRRTKIIATLGPTTDRRGEIDALIEAGVDCVRVNFSHGVADDHRKRIEAARGAAARHGTAIAVLGDLQGPKIRIAGFRSQAVQLRNGATFVLDPDRAANGGDATGVGLTCRRLAHDVKVGETLLFDDGNISLRVESIAHDTVVTRVISGGELSSHKGINLQGGGLSADSLTGKDLADITMAAALEADYLAVSFVRNAADIDRARQLLQAAGGTGHIVAKIERGEALDHIDAIIQTAARS